MDGNDWEFWGRDVEKKRCEMRLCLGWFVGLWIIFYKENQKMK